MSDAVAKSFLTLVGGYTLECQQSPDEVRTCVKRGHTPGWDPFIVLDTRGTGHGDFVFTAVLPDHISAIQPITPPASVLSR